MRIPERERWLFKNPVALDMVMEGLRQAKAGELVEDGLDIAVVKARRHEPTRPLAEVKKDLGI